MIYYPDPGKDYNPELDNYFITGKFGWSPSKRLLTTIYNSHFGRTYFILKGVSKEQFLRCMNYCNPNNLTTIKGNFVAEPSYRGITIRGIGQIPSIMHTHIQDKSQPVIKAYNTGKKEIFKKTKNDYYINALNNIIYLHVHSEMERSKRSELVVNSHIFPYNRNNTSIVDFVLPPAIYSEDHKKVTVQAKFPKTEEVIIETSEYTSNLRVKKGSLYHYVDRKKEGYRECKYDKHIRMFMPWDDICKENKQLFRKKIPIFKNRVIICAYIDDKYIRLTHCDKEELDSLVKPRSEVIREEIDKYPRRKVNFIRNKYGLDDSEKGEYNTLVQLRKTQSYNIKEMRERILDGIQEREMQYAKF